MTEFGGLGLSQIQAAMRDLGATQLYLKRLAPNDNSKNQPYFGGDFTALNILPVGTPVAGHRPNGKPIFKAPLAFSWLSDEGAIFGAPRAKLILYPQYPEVRFSGYLLGSKAAPNTLMGTTRAAGRLLFLGIRPQGDVIGYAASARSEAARDVASLGVEPTVGVFVKLPLGRGTGDGREELLRALGRIARAGWIDAQRLDGSGATVPCAGPNCGGYTLEAQLGIRPNGRSDPDFLGWEVKQYNVANFKNYRGGAITLMTPEPTGGVYKSAGVNEFVRRFGYDDAKREGRRNFGGVHRFATRCAKTGLTLFLEGWNTSTSKITDATGGICLRNDEGVLAAKWDFAGLISHWNRKHALAAYVPSQKTATTPTQYRYASEVGLGMRTSFDLFLKAMALGAIYYDPGIKVVVADGKTTNKRRSQFRLRSAELFALYESWELTRVT